MNKVNVLISGSGSLYGVAVIQFLLKSKLDLKLVACDVNARTLGLHLAHRGYILPPVNQEELYFSKLLSILQRESINAVFVTSSREIDFFSKKKSEIEIKTGAKVFTNSPEVLEICSDKWNTVSFLKEHGFLYPRSLRYPEDRGQLNTFVKKVKFPVVVKPRRGAGSKDLYVVDNFKELRSIIAGKKDLILQQYIPDDHGEYTTGICSGSHGKILSGITFKRYLWDGMTMAAVSEDYKGITNYCKEVAGALKAYGPCNYQLRLLKGKPYIFEINPRFSSTTGMRALLGVNEAEILIRAEILGEEIVEPDIPRCSIIRQFTDYQVQTERILKLESDNFCINNHK